MNTGKPKRTKLKGTGPKGSKGGRRKKGDKSRAKRFP